MSSLPNNYITDDDNRVVLQPVEGHEHDFVNASYVDVSTAIEGLHQLGINVSILSLGIQLREKIHCLPRYT